MALQRNRVRRLASPTDSTTDWVGNTESTDFSSGTDDQNSDGSLFERDVEPDPGKIEFETNSDVPGSVNNELLNKQQLWRRNPTMSKLKRRAFGPGDRVQVKDPMIYGFSKGLVLVGKDPVTDELKVQPTDSFDQEFIYVDSKDLVLDTSPEQMTSYPDDTEYKGAKMATQIKKKAESRKILYKGKEYQASGWDTTFTDFNMDGIDCQIDSEGIVTDEDGVWIGQGKLIEASKKEASQETGFGNLIRLDDLVDVYSPEEGLMESNVKVTGIDDRYIETDSGSSYPLTWARLRAKHKASKKTAGFNSYLMWDELGPGFKKYLKLQGLNETLWDDEDSSLGPDERNGTYQDFKQWASSRFNLDDGTFQESQEASKKEEPADEKEVMASINRMAAKPTNSLSLLNIKKKKVVKPFDKDEDLAWIDRSTGDELYGKDRPVKHIQTQIGRLSSLSDLKKYDRILVANQVLQVQQIVPGGVIARNIFTGHDDLHTGSTFRTVVSELNKVAEMVKCKMCGEPYDDNTGPGMGFCSEECKEVAENEPNYKESKQAVNKKLAAGVDDDIDNLLLMEVEDQKKEDDQAEKNKMKESSTEVPSNMATGSSIESVAEFFNQDGMDSHQELEAIEQKKTASFNKGDKVEDYSGQRGKVIAVGTYEQLKDYDSTGAGAELENDGGDPDHCVAIKSEDGETYVYDEESVWKV